MNGRIKMKIVDSSYKGEPVDACELCSDFELGYGVIHVGTVCPIEEARTVARKLYAEVKRLKEMNTDMFSDIQENCASCRLHGSDCAGCPFQYYHKRSR